MGVSLGLECTLGGGHLGVEQNMVEEEKHKFHQTYLSICLPVHPVIYSSNHSVCPPTRPAVSLFIHLSVHIHLSIHPSTLLY